MSHDEQGLGMTIGEGALPDWKLVQQVRQGDEVSFDTLFRRHYDRVYGILFRLVGNRAEAEDLAQEVFLKLYRRPPEVRGEASLTGWLYRVATNQGYNHLRGRKRRRQRDVQLAPGADPSEGLAWHEDPVRAAEAAEAAALVRATLSRLSERQVRLLVLRQMGLSYAELAEACAVAPGSVGQLLARAVRAFQKQHERLSQGSASGRQGGDGGKR